MSGWWSSSSSDEDTYQPLTERFTTEELTREANRVLRKHPDRIPVIVEVGQKSPGLKLTKHKFLVPKEFTMAQLLAMLRTQFTENLKPEEAVFMFVNNELPPLSRLVSVVYEEHKADCGFLFVVLCKESTFG